MDNLEGVITLTTLITTVLVTGGYTTFRTIRQLLTKDKRAAEEEQRQTDEREAQIKRENALRAELAEVYEEKQRQEREYLEKQIARLEDQIQADKSRYEREITAQQKTLATLEDTYQRLADKAQADKLQLEGQIETLTQQYERSEREREELTETLKETQAELKQTKDELGEYKIDKVVLERTNALLEQSNSQQEQQLDVLRGLVEPMRAWMMQNMAA